MNNAPTVISDAFTMSLEENTTIKTQESLKRTSNPQVIAFQISSKNQSENTQHKINQ